MKKYSLLFVLLFYISQVLAVKDQALSDPAIQEQGFPPQTIAIIGAGLAGLTAAHYLKQVAGVEVCVFEARSRVGGRVLTGEIRNENGEYSVVELGGQNATDGGDPKLFKKLAQELGLEIVDDAINFHAVICEEKISGKEKQYKYHDFETAMRKALNNCDTLERLNDQIDAWAQQSSSIKELLEKMFPENLLLQKVMGTHMMAEVGVKTKKQSVEHNLTILKGIVNNTVFPDSKASCMKSISIKGGNAKLALEIAKEIGAKNIHFNHKLTEIEITNDEKKVKLAFNHQNQEQYEYDYVLLAVPASMYPNINFDKCKVSETRLAHMTKVQYGSNYKIIVPFAVNDKDKYHAVINDGEISFGNDDNKQFLLYVNDNKSPQDLLSTIEIFKHALRAWNAASAENLPEDFINDKENVFTKKEKILIAEDEQYKKYEAGVTYLWRQDLYVSGSFPGYSTDLEKSFHEIISDDIGNKYRKPYLPICNRLFFAGDQVTVNPIIGTMEGAISSGIEAAQAITQRIEKYKEAVY